MAYKIKMMRFSKSLFIFRSLAMLAVAWLIAGCAVPLVGGVDGESREHADEVFHLQNQMTSEVMMLLESDGEKKHEALMQAEQHMQQVCADLNEYASRDIDGLSIGLLLNWRVKKSILDCEHAALALKQLLGP